MPESPALAQDLIAALAWQLELGADEAIAETPQDRFKENDQPPPLQRATPQLSTGAAPAAPRGPSGANPAAADARPEPGAQPRGEDDSAAALAGAATSLEELAEAMRGFDGSPLRHGARNFVFADGVPGARVMVIGEAPGGDEDRIGKPFVGRAGQLLDRMLAAIGLSRTAPAPEDAAYIANILPWRPPGNRRPTTDEVALFLPFVVRHIELAKPDFIFSVGNTPTMGLLDTATGIKRMRGTWVRHAATGLPLLPSFHPAYLLRTPADKRLAWRDLLALRAALDGDKPKV